MTTQPKTSSEPSSNSLDIPQSNSDSSICITNCVVQWTVTVAIGAFFFGIVIWRIYLCCAYQRKIHEKHRTLRRPGYHSSIPPSSPLLTAIPTALQSKRISTYSNDNMSHGSMMLFQQPGAIPRVYNQRASMVSAKFHPTSRPHSIISINNQMTMNAPRRYSTTSSSLPPHRKSFYAAERNSSSGFLNSRNSLLVPQSLTPTSLKDRDSPDLMFSNSSNLSSDTFIENMTYLTEKQLSDGNSSAHSLTTSSINNGGGSENGLATNNNEMANSTSHSRQNSQRKSYLIASRDVEILIDENNPAVEISSESDSSFYQHEYEMDIEQQKSHSQKISRALRNSMHLNHILGLETDDDDDEIDD
ncbi:hypothetical protein G9A89_019548 [Geosiphon pyriformis]|nr:hypothetical protein G9A89_019548 [Geosiphon pyriformis]